MTTAHHPTPVVAAVIHRGDTVLVCQRPPAKRHAGLWEFPGGKVHPGESVPDALRRELQEELGVGVTSTGTIHMSLMDPGSPFVIDFVDVEIDGEPCALEHSAVAWVSPAQLLSMPLAPSDREFASRVFGVHVQREHG